MGKLSEDEEDDVLMGAGAQRVRIHGLGDTDVAGGAAPSVLPVRVWRCWTCDGDDVDDLFRCHGWCAGGLPSCYDRCRQDLRLVCLHPELLVRVLA